MSQLSKAEKKDMAKTWKAAQRKAYILSEENVRELFDFLEEHLEDAPCDHTLSRTNQWLIDNLPAEKMEGALAEIARMGGYCDCEVLLNCYEDYDIE